MPVWLNNLLFEDKFSDSSCARVTQYDDLLLIIVCMLIVNKKSFSKPRWRGDQSIQPWRCRFWKTGFIKYRISTLCPCNFLLYARCPMKQN